MTAAAQSAYRCCFETYESLEDVRKKQTLPLKPQYLEAFDNDIKRMLQEKSKVLRWVVDKVPFLREIESSCTEFVGYLKDIFPAYKSVKAACSIVNELSNLEKLKTETSSDCKKATLCNQVKQCRKVR